MNIETLTKENMEALQKLADVNLAISEANSKLEDLKSRETEYLKIRKGKVAEQIEALYQGSADLLEKTHKNYEGVHTFCNILTNYKGFLEENYAAFQKMLTEFEERNKEWNRRYEEQVAELGRQEKIVRKDEEEIKKGKKEVAEANEQIRRDRIKIEDERRTLQRTVERLKANQK